MMKRLVTMLVALALCLAGLSGTAEERENDMRMTIGETPVTVVWEDNASVAALRALAAEELTIEMSMYGGFEQVGPIGQSLPSQDRQTTTRAGDIVLYSASQLVVFYGSNSWAYTRLGRIADKTPGELAQLLGSGDVTITLDCRTEGAPGTVLELPSGTERIESEAFAGVSAEAVILPENLKHIAPDAFANSGVRFIYGRANTLAEAYAAEHGLTFVPIEGD